jgi:hypothetical protein
MTKSVSLVGRDFVDDDSRSVVRSIPPTEQEVSQLAADEDLVCPARQQA